MPTAVSALRRDLDRAGYYPDVVGDVLDVALGGEPVVTHLVHPETTFDSTEVRRHLTVLCLTATRLVVAHVDDHPADSENPSASALATSEAVPLSRIRTVGLTHVVTDPGRHRPGEQPAELNLAVDWGGVSRLDLEPASCSDPHCEADHGLTGSSAPDDLLVRVSAAAEGVEAVRQAVDFARALSGAVAAAR